MVVHYLFVICLFGLYMLGDEKRKLNAVQNYMVEYLENVCNEIKKFDFSPMEKIMYVYDLVRSRIYIDTDYYFW